MVSQQVISKLKDLIADAWKNGFKNDYMNGIVIVEGNAQLRLGKHLIDRLEPDYTVYGMPEIEIENETEFKPDFVFVYKDEIIGVGELKCRPWWRCPFKRDFEKFKEIFSSRDYKQQLRANPYTGKYDDKDYSISKNVNFFFFAVCREDAVALDCEAIIKKLQKYGWSEKDFDVLKNTTLFYGKIYDGSKEPIFGVDDFKKYI